MPVIKTHLLTLSVLATAALTEFSAVSYAGAVPSAGTAALGFVTTDAASGDMVAVDVLGTTIAVTGAAVAQGALLEIGSSGKVITKDTGVIVGRAMQAADAANAHIEILLLPN